MAFASGGDHEKGGDNFDDSGGTGGAANRSHGSGIQPQRKNKKSKRRVSHLRGMWNQIKPINKLSRVGDSPRLTDGHTCDAPPQMRRRDTPSSPWGSPAPRKAAKGKAFKGPTASASSSSRFSFEMSDCDDDVSTSTFSFDSEASSNSFDFSSSNTNCWSPGPPSTMRRKRKTHFSFDDTDDSFDENMMDSLDAAMAPIDTHSFKVPSTKSPHNSVFHSTVPTHYQELAAAQDRTVSAPTLSGHSPSRTKASIAHNRKQKLPNLATSTPTLATITPSVPVFSAGASAGASSATGGAARRKGRRRNLGLTLDCDAIQADTSIIEPLSCRKSTGQASMFRAVCSPITDFLFLGGFKVALDRRLLDSHGITHVINCVSHKCDCAFPKHLCYLPFQFADNSSQDITPYLYLVIGFIEAVRRARGRVLVHCMQGISRSAALVIAYCMWSKGLQVDVALKSVQSIRSVVNPNASFLFQLSDWNINRPLYLKPGSTSVFRVERHKLRIKGVNFPPYNAGALLPLLTGPLSRLSTDMFAPMDALRAQEIDHIYIVIAATGIFLWTSKKLPRDDMDAAKLAVQQLQLAEKRDCDKMSVVQAGNEPPEFWNSFAYLPLASGARVTPQLRTSRVEPATSHFQKLKI